MADIYVKRDEVIEEIKSSFDADTAIAAVMALETKTPEDFMEIKEPHKKVEKEIDNSAWEFHWDGRGSYEEERRCFYGDFS